tara:strand:- start:506 stop:1453 length:948 start_codon:yes stop_codon:yes gene_type:complete
MRSHKSISKSSNDYSISITAAMQFVHPVCGDVYDAEILRRPTELPERSHRASLSQYYLLNNGKKVNVPWSAIVRDRPALEIDDGVALVPRHCTHANVVVLRAIDGDGDTLYGWFAKRKSNLLQRLTKRMIIQIGLACNITRPSSSLVNCFTDALFAATTCAVQFESLAIVRFERKRCILDNVALTSQKHIKKRQSRQSRQSRPARARGARIAKRDEVDEKTCAVCMEEFVGTARRTQNACTCKTPICTVCSDRMRGLCAICDRSKYNGHYECHCCGGIEDISSSGFPCVTCGKHVLCTTCFRSFEECCACDPIAL